MPKRKLYAGMRRAGITNYSGKIQNWGRKNESKECK